MRRTLSTAIMAVALVAPSVRADEIEARPGTVFLAELEVGPAWGGAFAEDPSGLAWGVTFGAGGKPRGWPMRFYGIARLRWTSLSDEAVSAIERSSTERELFEWMVGLRALAPITRHLRFFGEFGLGAARVASTATLGGGAERIANDDASFLVNFGLGLQYRLHYNFSLGARLDVALPTGFEPYDPLAEAAGVSSNDAGAANLGGSATVTLHF